MVWCVEDDPSILDVELYALESTGFKARGFKDGTSFWNALVEVESKSEQCPELVVLDVMLPGIDGIELLNRMRKSSLFAAVPVVMATAKGSEYDRIKGLDSGADYYIAKPFGVMELVSCIKAVLRRCKSTDNEPHILKSYGIVLNVDERTVKAGGKDVGLTFKEFEVLRLFMAHPGIVFSRDKLFNDVWGFDYYGESRTVDMHIRTLRQKLGDYGYLIRTVRNVGYGLSFGDSAADGTTLCNTAENAPLGTSAK